MYLLEVLNFGRWEAEADFRSQNEAIMYGRENFSHNEWRITSNNVLHYLYDPMDIVKQEGQQQLQTYQRNAEFTSRRDDRIDAMIAARTALESVSLVKSLELCDIVDWAVEGF